MKKTNRRCQTLLERIAVLIALFFAFASGAEARVITADVVALDQVITWNRFGSYNPAGMMYALRRDVVDFQGRPIGLNGGTPGRVTLRSDKRPRPLVLRVNVGDTLVVRFTNLLAAGRPDPNAPTTRLASIVVNGLTPLGDNGIVGVSPGGSVTYSWTAEREGTHLIFSNGAPAGGEGDGGSLVLGLFGAVNVESAGSQWYRSQATAADMAAGKAAAVPPAVLNYEAKRSNGEPILNILHNNEIIYSDLNAIIVFDEPSDGVEATTEGSFREFTAIFHDELKTVHSFAILDHPVMHGVRDGFGVNYGSDGAGARIVANREGVGPAKDCVECAYEEFFLSSWANGDPALLVGFPDDPSNVHHSYLNDKVKFRNLHAGPKETHVFHLHGHQWLAETDGENSTYLDSQTIGPLQGFSYEILYGGTGNRNRMPGDSIYHCHLYPHFAQGMWALWRTHEVFEDGTRALPDGEFGSGTDPLTGKTFKGTPIPAVVPIPGQALPPNPTYGPNGMPGYPFYIPGVKGHRPPQPPLDLVADGGLPRHLITGGTRIMGSGVAGYDFSAKLTSAKIKLIEPDGTSLEKAAMAFHAAAAGHSTITPEGTQSTFSVNGLPPQPGAPYADPCTPSLTTGMREYRVSAVQTDLVVNKHGWHDPQARIAVLDADVGMYEGKSTVASPFFFRANSGECITFYHTNRTPHELDRDAFQVRTPTDTLGQHIHLVKFDVTSSDGSANGWNYEDGTFAKGAIAERIEASHAKFGSAVKPDGAKIRLAATGGYQTTVQRWFADPLLNRTGRDRTLRTAFTHDHFAASSIQQHGYYAALVVEPAGSRWLNPQGGALAGGVGTQAMIVGATDSQTHPDHREFMMAVADFGLVYTAGGAPVNPPDQPEAISSDDPGTFLVNYKNEPVPLRISPNGALPLYADKRGDMANIFSSSAHGDPFTEIYKAFEGDRIQIRLIQGAQEEQHSASVHGMRWKREPDNPRSQYVNAQEVGLSEHFELEVPNLADVETARFADYLYYFGAIDDFWNGNWGLLRTFADSNAMDPATGAKVALAMLPNNPTGRVSTINASDFGGNVCPKTAPTRTFSIEAWAAKDLLPEASLIYNRREGISDPSGLLYVLQGDVPALRAGARKAEPLILRANAGDCIRVQLTNRLPLSVPDHPGDSGVPPITALQPDDFRPSNRVSLHPQLVSYNIVKDDGANVGYNKEQTAIPGGSQIYTWYAGVISIEKTPDGYKKIATPVEFGPVNLQPFGDVVKQGSQGLVGALIIEPEGSTHVDPVTGSPITSGTVAKITAPNGNSFKEFVLVYQDGLNLLENGALMPDQFVADDAEDTGEKAINYRTEPFCARLGLPADCDTNEIAYPSTFMLGEVETPLLTASAGETVRFRVVQPSGRARQRGFSVLGHDYPDGGLPNFGASGNSLIAVGRAVDAVPYGGAKAGTWIYRDAPTFLLSGGAWGRFEVK